MSAVSLASLLIQETKDKIYSTALSIASAIGVPVSSWQAGDPTRSLFYVEAETLSTLEGIVANFIAAGFLDYASGDWLKLLANQFFNVTVPDATFASTTETLTNTGGGVFDIDPGDLTFQSSISGKTYHCTTGGHLGAGGTLDVTIVADEAGSDSSAGSGEIDTMVTPLLGVTCANTLAAVGLDEQSDDTTKQQCRDKVGSFSPAGPKEAYSYVARNSNLTGSSSTTRVRVFGDSDIGEVDVFVAGPNAGIGGTELAKVEAAIAQWATPLCITPVVADSSVVTVPVTYQLWIYQTVNTTTDLVEAAVQSALEDLFPAKDIGGDIIPPATTGSIYVSLIESTIRGVYPEVFRVIVTSPGADVALTNSQIAALGTVTPTVNLVPR